MRPRRLNVQQIANRRFLKSSRASPNTQLMNRCYERASTVLTSNKGFEEWGQVLGDEVMAAALIDRVLPHCHLVNIRGNSYRMREHTELYRSLRPEAEAAAPIRSNRSSKSTSH